MMPKWKLYSIKQRIVKRDNHTCQYCKKRFPPKVRTNWEKINKKLTIDHVLPRSKGGTWDDTNLVAACKECNSKKADKIL